MQTVENDVRTDGVIKVVPGERFTPYTLAKKLGAKAVLESSSFTRGRERYSILLVKEAFKLSQEADGVFLESDRGRTKLPDRGEADILDRLVYFANQHPALHQDLPVPAGGIGYLSWEFARRCDRFGMSEKPDPLGVPEALFLFGHVFIVFDHYTDNLYLIGINYREHEIDLSHEIAEVQRKLRDLDFNYLAEGTESYRAERFDRESGRESFLAGVARIKQEIVAGNLLQCVLSRRETVKTPMPPLEAYRRLRSENPSPYLFYFDFGRFQLLGSSPELQVRVKDDRVTIRPIAGTRRRGRDKAEDEALEAELRDDGKEKAEHLMLVDLARNDIGRIAKPGSVKVTEFMNVERYSHVMHLVSQVEGTLAPGLSGVDAVRATFPAGTVSGAPKIRAVDVLESLEAVRRGFYAGLVGYMEPDGNLETCITIRSAIMKDGTATLHAGAGIVYDSVPEREYEETVEKLAVLAKILGPSDGPDREV